MLLDIAPVVMRAAGDVTDLQAAQALSDLLDARGVSPDAGSNLGADPIGRAVRARRPVDRRSYGLVAAGIGDISALATTAGVRALTVDGTCGARRRRR